MKKVTIIAEVGVNHNGKIELAKKLIDAAAEAKVDYVKFQTWITEELMEKTAPKAEYQKKNDGASTSQFEMTKQLELSFDEFRELRSYCKKKGVKFLSTPDEIKSLDFLADELDLPIIKVGSGEITNIPFLRKVGSKKKEVILSTGMANIGEVERAYHALISSGAKKVSLLHCTSNYPAPYDSVNLKAMLTLKKAFATEVGYSDHTMGNEVSIAAVALGAKIIEKHFTLDRNMPGPDHKASITPSELTELVRQIRHVESALNGDGRKLPQNSELETKKVVTKGIYLYKDVSEGSILTDDALVLKRPVGEIPGEAYDLVIGRKVMKDLKKGNVLHWKDISM